MAELVVSASVGVMKPLLAKLATLAGDEYKKLKGVRKEVVFLVKELSAMDAFLDKMEDADELDSLAKNWRSDIREMAYDIKDCIDDFMHRLGGADDKDGIVRKTARRLRTLRARHQIANQIQELKARVLEASERRMRYKLDDSVSTSRSVAVDPRLWALYNESASLVGIEGPRDELIERVVDKERQLKVVSIVGFGGLGKTTLANEVYRKIGEQFNCKEFVSVSQRPDMTRLLISLLSKIGLHPSFQHPEVQDLIDDLREHLQHKRMWWELWWNRTLNHTRGHLIELVNSTNVLISNITLRNSPFWTVHPVYCRNVVIKDLTILAPVDAPNTDGIDPVLATGEASQPMRRGRLV